MTKVGITGGIGSGKTLICQVFEKFGIPVFYADEEAKKLLNNDPKVKEAIKEFFGSEVYNESGIDKAFLASKIFNNGDALAKVNSIVHPEVRKSFLRWARAKESAYPYVIEEAAILFESGGYKDLDFSVLVYAPEELRIKRVTERDKTNREDVEARMKHQMKDEEKINMADAVIYNDESQLVIPQILRIHQQLNRK
ncbi:MAG: dephospho-CoA kinase [Bacteroidales bacterium]